MVAFYYLRVIVSVTMRRKPVSRDEVRFDNRRRRISTLPASAIIDHKPIPKLWAPLLKQLNVPCPVPANSRPRACKHCGGLFYTVMAGGMMCKPRYCSDHCQREANAPQRAKKIAKMVRRKSEALAAARAGRKCETCGEKIEAQRSTMRFCSVKCRVAAHRASHTNNKRQGVNHVGS